MLAIRIHNRRRVHVVSTLLLPMSAKMAWGQMRCFRYFVGLDPFHANIRSPDGSPPAKAGDAIILGHQFGPIQFDRVGRILKWREGHGYSFSDLSRNDARNGFPHIFTYALLPRGLRRCRLVITMRGHWTYPLWPSWLIRRWFAWVFTHTLQAMRNRLLMIAIRR